MQSVVRHVTVDDIPIFDGDLPAALRVCGEALRAGSGARIATANLDFLALARRNAQLAADLRSSSIVVADGMPVAWLARLLGGRKTRRIAGVDLVREICRDFGAERELRIALYGSTEQVIAGATGFIEGLSDGARVVFAASPPFRKLAAWEVQEYRSSLVASRPDVVLVALGCPAQERVIAEWFSVAPQALWIGVGGTLDFFAGHRRRAPRAVQAMGLEWVFRMAQEPDRLAARYLGRDLPALAGIMQRSLETALRRRRSPAA
jgi:N-acetylglucosaminyldiphosphoundecaprenol N-acetyl-beta-D-mannosaminyltransferase